MLERLQGGKKESERSAQFMADICKESALDFIELFQLSVGYLEKGVTSIQFKPGGKFAKTQPVVEEISSNDNDARQQQEVEVVHDEVAVERSAGGTVELHGNADAHVHRKDDSHRQDGFPEVPADNDAHSENDEV